MEVDAAEARILPAGALPDPMVGLRVEDADVDVVTYGVRQTLPLWGKRKLARDIAFQEATGLREEHSAITLERLADAERAYVRYWHADATLQVVDRLIDLLSTIEAVARERYALGLAAQQDVIRAQVARSRMQSERIERIAVREEAVAQLNTGLGRPVDAALNPPSATPTIRLPIDSRDAGLTILRTQSHPMLRAKNVMADAADDALELQRRQRLPDITIGFDLMQMGSRANGYELMFEVEIPLQRGALREREREASLRLDAARARIDQTLSSLEGRFGEVWARWSSAQARQRLYRDTLLPQTEANFSSALASYRVSEVDFATLLEALEACKVPTYRVWMRYAMNLPVPPNCAP